MTDPDAFIDSILRGELASQQRDYSRFRRRRYRFLLSVVEDVEKQFFPGPRPPVRLLDVGPSFQTLMLAGADSVRRVETVGFRDFSLIGDATVSHHEFDLNKAQDADQCPRIGPYDIIVFSEVLEHLHTAPSLIFRCLTGWLAAGGVLILQTPNAVSFGRRKEMLLGRNPAEPIREDARNPGHFREYTSAEIREFAVHAGLELISLRLENYFGEMDLRRLLYNLLCRCVLFEVEEGITAVFRKAA